MTTRLRFDNWRLSLCVLYIMTKLATNLPAPHPPHACGAFPCARCCTRPWGTAADKTHTISSLVGGKTQSGDHRRCSAPCRGSRATQETAETEPISRPWAACPLSTAPSQRSPFEAVPQQLGWGQALGDGALVACASHSTGRRQGHTCAPTSMGGEGIQLFLVSLPWAHTRPDLGIHLPLDAGAHT